MNDCPVLQEAQNILHLSKDLNQAMRRLKRKLNHCRKCELQNNCPAIEALQKMILEAIQEVAEEMNLVP